MNTKAPIAEVKQGLVRGAVVKNVDGGSYLAFDGIPFAQPPIGELRFKDPLPAKAWNGIRNLDAEFPKPSQYDMALDYYAGTEDCLYLNVATRSLEGKRPVMVWIHGGAFTMCTASTNLYRPDYLMKRDVVFVSVAYRLGCFGFLNLNLPEASGNQAMKDLVAGLKWVQENIQAFGGDPGNVTLAGHSAGSAAVHLLTLSPLAKGLFHKAIAQSGSATCSWTYSDNPVDSGLRLAAVLGKPSDEPAEALKILMKATKDQLLKAQTKISTKDMFFNFEFHFTPSVDTASPNPFMPDHPKEMAKRGINVPLIVGTTTDEGLIATPNPDLEGVFREINTNFIGFLSRHLQIADRERITKIGETVKKFYFGETKTVTIARNLDGFARFIGDVHFYFGIREKIEFQLNCPTPSYVYQFSHIPSYPTEIPYRRIEGVSHGDELGALFHRPCLMGTKGLQVGTKDYCVMEKLTRLWANFMRTGDPTVEVDDKVITTRWEPITRDKMNYLDISENLVPRSNYCETSWRFWKSIFETL